VFSPDSKVAYFNRAVDRIRADPRCVELLGAPAKRITAYGEATANKWRRARPIASAAHRDAQGHDHLVMHFNVEGPRNRGVVHLHLVKYAGRSDYQYRYLFLDVPGQQRLYLENADAKHKAGERRTTLFGIRWS